VIVYEVPEEAATSTDQNHGRLWYVKGNEGKVF
jgi:hypothetical protein